MTMGIGAAAAGQLTATRSPGQQEPTNKAVEGFKQLTKTDAESEKSEQQRLALTEHSGKGQNIDILA